MTPWSAIPRHPRHDLNAFRPWGRIPLTPRKHLFRTCSMSFWSHTSTLPGWDARRGAQWIARLSISAATPQTARQGTCPQGWSEIGGLDAPTACMGMSPCGASEASTPPDCAPTRLLRDREHVLMPLPQPQRRWVAVKKLWTLAQYPSSVCPLRVLDAAAQEAVQALLSRRYRCCL